MPRGATIQASGCQQGVDPWLVKHEDELSYSRCGPALLCRRDSSSNTSIDVSKLALVVLQTELCHILRDDDLGPHLPHHCCPDVEDLRVWPSHPACRMSCGPCKCGQLCVCLNGLYPFRIGVLLTRAHVRDALPHTVRRHAHEVVEATSRGRGVGQDHFLCEHVIFASPQIENSDW